MCRILPCPRTYFHERIRCRLDSAPTKQFAVLHYGGRRWGLWRCVIELLGRLRPPFRREQRRTAFCFRLVVAFAGFALCFFIHHSSFCLRPAVAFVGFGPAFILHPSAFIIRFGVALMSH